jgi:U3 small nucleolar RNA-associated protein 19
LLFSFCRSFHFFFLVNYTALESSLWELSALEKHYHPAVSALAKVCGKEDALTLPYDMDDFLLHTYKSLFEEESHQKKQQQNKKRKAVPLTFVEPDKLFPVGDALHGIIDV